MTALLESKFFQPRPRPDIVARPRLIAQLNTGLERKLILVLAQAGFGKSTLVSQWLDTLAQAEAPGAARPYRVAWLSLDENDNDPLRFFDYLIAALQRADAGVGQRAREMLSAPQPPANLEPLVISIINDLITRCDHLILALDDYHTITSQAVHQAIHYLISHLPELVHIMIISRVEPPLPLTRWRMHRELVEIRAHDLRFTRDEAMTYLLETMHCNISRADVDSLEQRTEGWIVGLHLAALSLQSHPNAAAFIADFTGSHAYIVDYLTEEVLQRQPVDIQEFLFQTAWLSRFSGPLCDAVTGRTGSQKTLEFLERSHLFVVPLDNERGWYRYHHLFAEMLRRRAQEHTQHDGEPSAAQQNRRHRAEILRRAAQWHVAQGLVMEAIEYALAAEDGESAAALIADNLPPLMVRGQFVTILQWLNRLPRAALAAWPLLSATRARIALRQQNLDEAEQWLEFTWDALAAQPNQDPLVTGEAYAIRVDLALNRGELDQTIQLANEALKILSENVERPRGEILLFLGIAHFWKDQYAEALTATLQSARIATRAEDILTALFAWVNHARFSLVQGKLHECLASLEQAWAFATQHNVQQQSLMGTFYTNNGEISYEWNRLDAAEENFLRAIELSEQAQNPRTLLRGYSLLLPVYRAKADNIAAERTVQNALRIMRQYELPANLIDECSRTIIRQWLDDGNLQEVEAWLEKRGLDANLPDVLTSACATQNLEHEYYLVARYLAIQNNLADAAALLDKCATSAYAVGKLTTYIMIQAYHALVLQQAGDKRAASRLMSEVLEIAAPQGYIRTFLDEGKAMQKLLTTLQPQLPAKLQGYVNLLRQAFAQPSLAPPQPQAAPSATAAAPPPDDAPYVERLSERELEVLRWVDEGLSDSQIAAKLILAVGTVKRHLNNIYGKLGVHTRTQALARARALQLL